MGTHRKHSLTKRHSGLTPLLYGNRLLFQGRDRDPDTGLYNFRNRYYSPTLGRFLQTDPIRVLGGLNLYAFVRNRPLNKVDPLGLKDWGPFGGKCCNRSTGDEWALVAGGMWSKLKPGECTGEFVDCDGMTCGGGFYAVYNLETGICANPRNDCPMGAKRRWTPTNAGPKAEPPVWDPSIGKGRGSQEGNTPRGYIYD